ncbi:hypothetical protein [Klebsiella michiganensis]|jgi:hypothetical protein
MLFAVTAFSDFAGKLSAQFIVLVVTPGKVQKTFHFKAMDIYFA